MSPGQQRFKWPALTKQSGKHSDTESGGKAPVRSRRAARGCESEPRSAQDQSTQLPDQRKRNAQEEIEIPLDLQTFGEPRLRGALWGPTKVNTTYLWLSHHPRFELLLFLEKDIANETSGINRSFPIYSDPGPARGDRAGPGLQIVEPTRDARWRLWRDQPGVATRDSPYTSHGASALELPHSPLPVGLTFERPSPIAQHKTKQYRLLLS